jgi:hypothetical protein
MRSAKVAEPMTLQPARRAASATVRSDVTTTAPLRKRSARRMTTWSAVSGAREKTTLTRPVPARVSARRAPSNTTVKSSRLLRASDATRWWRPRRPASRLIASCARSAGSLRTTL